MTTQQTMSLAKLFREYANGDETGWDEERAWLEANHPRRLARITAEIRDGFFPPVRICFKEKRVIDGHHRIVAAASLGRTRIPVADAWDGTDWWRYADDNGGDDAEDAAALMTTRIREEQQR